MPRDISLTNQQLTHLINANRHSGVSRKPQAPMMRPDNGGRLRHDAVLGQRIALDSIGNCESQVLINLTRRANDVKQLWIRRFAAVVLD